MKIACQIIEYFAQVYFLSLFTWDSRFFPMLPTEEMEIEKLKVADLRAALNGRGLDTKGTKPILVQRLKVRLLFHLVLNDFYVKRKVIFTSKYRPILWLIYSQEAIAQDGAPQSEPAVAAPVGQDTDQSTAPVEVQDDVSLISIIFSSLDFSERNITNKQ